MYFLLSLQTMMDEMQNILMVLANAEQQSIWLKMLQ